MKEFELKGYKIDELIFNNKINGAVKIELTHKYSYNVGYAKNNTCRGTFKAEISDKNNPEQFNITLVLTAMFQTVPNVQKEILHVKTYDAVFPYVKATVSNLTVNAGIPPIYIPYVDISNQNIYRVEMPHITPPEQGNGEFGQ